MTMLLVLFFLIGGAMAAGPWFYPQLGLTAQSVICVIGCAVLCVDAFAITVTRLYRKASANMAYVRTGMRGAKVIRDNGAIVVPVLHQVIPVSLETMRLNVERRGPHALI